MTATPRRLDPIRSDRLNGIRHGFFTRKGGASSGVFEGLNCGFGSSDQAEIVAMNRARVASAMGVETGALVTVHQTHSAQVVTVDGPLPDPRPEADALVSATPGLALGVLAADCQPVLFSDAEAGVVGAAHAGWRGALGGVLEATIDAMSALGARRDRIDAAIGPTISQRSYEVGEEFLDAFLDVDPSYTRFFANGAAGKYQFDLPGFSLARLHEAGVTNCHWTGHCTYAAPDQFYSYRRSCHRSEADYGRQISVIRL